MALLYLLAGFVPYLGYFWLRFFDCHIVTGENLYLPLYKSWLMRNIMKNWWWLGLILLYLLGTTLRNSDSKSSNFSSSTERVQYYKWKCRWCGNRIPIDQVLSPNEGVYTPENGYAFCSQECWIAFRNKIFLKID